MDPKGRMAIPTRIRDALLSSCAGRLVLTAHPEERCLLVYPEPRWQEVLPSIQALPTLQKAARRVQRLFLGETCLQAAIPSIWTQKVAWRYRRASAMPCCRPALAAWF